MILRVYLLTLRNADSFCGQDNDRRVRMSVERARDAYAGLLFHQARPDVRPDRISLMG